MILQKIKATPMKVLFIAPHLSTGGMPAFLLKRIQALQQYSNFEIYVIEWKFYSPDYVVQRKQIQELVGENFYSLLGDGYAQKGIIDFFKERNIFEGPMGASGAIVTAMHTAAVDNNFLPYHLPLWVEIDNFYNNKGTTELGINSISLYAKMITDILQSNK